MYNLAQVKKEISAQKRRLKYLDNRFEISKISKVDYYIRLADIMEKLTYLEPLKNTIIHRQELKVYEKALQEKLKIGQTSEAFIKEINSGFDRNISVNYEVAKISANSEIEYGYKRLKLSLKDMKVKDLILKRLK